MCTAKPNAKAQRRKLFKKQKGKKCCSFTGVFSTRERRLRAPCAAARGGERHLMRDGALRESASCVHSRANWTCLRCWDGIAEKAKELVASRSKT